MTMGTQEQFDTSYEAVKERLCQPVPRELIRQREAGRDRQGNAIYVDYINVTDYKDLLDERVGTWEAVVAEFKQISESLCVVVKLIIHTDDGAFAQDGTGIESIAEFSGYGDPFSNAYAQAFRRACEGHGLSRELWRGESGSHAPQHGTPESVKRTVYSQPDAALNAPTQPAAVAVNFAELVTAKQLGMIRALARELHLDPDEECLSIMQCRSDELSKSAASSFIKHLQELQKGGPAMPVERMPLRRAS